MEALIDTSLALVAPAVLGAVHLGLRWVFLTAALMGLRTGWTNVLSRRQLPAGPKLRVSALAGLGGFVMFLIGGAIVYALVAFAAPHHQVSF